MRSTKTWAWLGMYLLVVVAVVAAMLEVRHRTLAGMATPQAQADWQAWREAAPNQREDLPVKRRAPKSTEPPALVLMRDHFPVLLGAAVVFSSLLFAALSLAARGVFSRDLRRNHHGGHGEHGEGAQGE